MNSCIYEGLVKHTRLVPKVHEFTYPLFMMYVDLDELPTLFNSSKLWTVEKPGLATFRRNDHYGNSGDALPDAIRKLIYSKVGVMPNGPIRLLTHFRYFGYIFNPLSLYYCYNAAGNEVEYIVAEVMNTPWREQHCYVLPCQDSKREHITYSHPKEFHVSPFMDLDMEYQWKISRPSDCLQVNIENWQNKEKLFSADFNLQRLEFSPRNLRRILLGYPAMTIKVIGSIYFQAIKLWMKGIEYVPYKKVRRS